MSLSFRALSPFVATLALPLLMAQLPASAAAPVRKAAAAKPAAAAAPVKASSAIIALPLNPVLPEAQRLCEARTPEGLGYSVLRPTTGNKPAEADYVLVNYIGYLAATGAVFDQNMHTPFPVNGVVPGFSKGLQMMTKGSIARFCIPAAMGYGAEASGPIPANSDLVFQVELVDYKTAAEVDAMRKAQEAPAPAQEPAQPAAPQK
ncbi:FKBP-type peptidyl-prolyl cis-trans isomerase [Novosphingobium terrae]|jgi:FKBP-type peptidyl-prolyl cis-trans isomerase FkpA|uniref:FKBP-type peptidyl-prolyl cis-trans isomerase n=1 Tax=Novosphingobium terrae TaxID=2726189 RepID=UPI00197E77D1|nr:FKBP-type peptidyl-prolyl cis-trans isomerase [Novosphingobium terrae]